MAEATTGHNSVTPRHISVSPKRVTMTSIVLYSSVIASCFFGTSIRSERPLISLTKAESSCCSSTLGDIGLDGLESCRCL